MSSLRSRRSRVIIVHGTGPGRDGLRTLVQGLPQLMYIAEATHGPKVLQLVRDRNPDIVIFEMTQPEAPGMEMIQSIHQAHPLINLLVIAVPNDPAIVRDVVASGVGGCVLKDASMEEIGRALVAVARGETYYGEEVSNMVLEEMSKIAQRKAG